MTTGRHHELNRLCLRHVQPAAYPLLRVTEAPVDGLESTEEFDVHEHG